MVADHRGVDGYEQRKEGAALLRIESSEQKNGDLQHGEGIEKLACANLVVVGSGIKMSRSDESRNNDGGVAHPRQGIHRNIVEFRKLRQYVGVISGEERPVKTVQGEEYRGVNPIGEEPSEHGRSECGGPQGAKLHGGHEEGKRNDQDQRRKDETT